MKNKKMFSVALIAICLMTGCVSKPTVAVYDNDKKIASDSNTFNLINYEQTLEDRHFTASAEKMEGMDTIWSFNASEDTTIDITYSLNVFSGKMKLVLINPKGEVLIVTECDSEMTEPVQDTLNIESGNNRIKIVADENTKFDMDISISEGEFIELGFVFVPTTC